MHIAMLATDPAASHGWSRHARALIAALAAQGVAVSLITAADAAPDPNLPVRAYYRVLPSLTPPPRFSTLRLLRAISTVQRIAANCEALHIVAEPYTLATVGVGKPRVVTAHGTYLPQTAVKPGVGALYRWAYRKSRIICVSSYTERQVRAVLPNAQTTVILNGVDAQRFAQSDAPRPAKRGSTILAVGQIKARKGFHILAQAMRAIRAEFPSAEAVFVGDPTFDPAYVQAIKAQLAADGLSDAVRWLGRTSDETLLGWYRAADVFALPALNIDGRFEGFGLVYLEASAAGLPVIGTRDCGAEDAIRDGETGLLVAQNDPGALAEAVLRLLRDPGLRAQMGAAGAVFAAQHTWDQVARRVLNIYCAL